MHWVQHTPMFLCRLSILMIMCWHLHVPSASGMPPYRSTTASQLCLRGSKVKLPHHSSKILSEPTNESCLSPQFASHWLSPDEPHPEVLLQSPKIIASKCVSKLVQLPPPCVSPKWLDHGIQVHAPTHSIMASQCISKSTQFLSAIVSPNSLDHSPQVYLWVHAILASKCISNLTQSRPPCVFLNSHDYGLGVYLCGHSILTTKCFSELARLEPPSASLSPLDLGLQVHLHSGLIPALK